MSAAEPEYVTKSDLYYVAFLLLSGMLAIASYIAVSVDDHRMSVLLIALSVGAYSMGIASKYDGFHSRIWRVLE